MERQRLPPIERFIRNSMATVRQAQRSGNYTTLVKSSQNLAV